MAVNERRRKVRGESVALDIMHIVIGIAVVIMAVISFVNPDDYRFLFPIIFFLAAILNLATGKYHMLRSKRDEKKKIQAFRQMCFGGALVILAVISAVSLWWR